MLSLLPDLKLPKVVVAYGFDIVPPQTRELLGKLSFVECRPEPVEGKALRTSYDSAKHELEAAAKWARARLEDGRGRIGVVVPGLNRRRREVARVFSRVMRPGFNLPGAAPAAMPFNLSLGEPLAEYPLVSTAFDLLELSGRPVEFALASRLIRSPFLGGADSEMAARARLDARLRRNLDATVTLPKLIAEVESCPLLRKFLERVFNAKTFQQTSPPATGRGISPPCSKPPASRASARSTRRSSRRAPSGTRRSASSPSSSEFLQG